MLKTILAFLAGLVVGAAGLYFGLPTVIHSRAVAAAEVKLKPQPFDAKTADVITEGPIQSNLADAGHYVSLSFSFQVSPSAFAAAGGSGAGGGSTGTGSTLLDARIQNLVTDILRSTSYTSLEQSGGTSVLKARLSAALQSIFGPGTIGAIYFTNLVTQ